MSGDDRYAERLRRAKDFEAVLKLGRRGIRARSDFSLDEDWKASGLEAPVESFIRGAHRVGQPIELLRSMYSYGEECQYLADVIRLQETSTLRRPEMQRKNDEQPPSEETYAREERLYAKIAEARRAVDRGEFSVPQGGLKILDFSLFGIEGVVAGWNDTMRENSLRGLYEAVIILAWSTFETVAEDLWESAVNARPSKLASGKVETNDLKRFRFDVRNKLGTILKRSSEHSLRSLAGIREAYIATFKDKGEKIRSILCNCQLQYTAAVRNVLIHKGGRIDEEYLEQVAKVPGAFRAEVGTRLPIDGQTTYERAEAVLAGSAALLKATRAWILAHPEKSIES